MSAAPLKREPKKFQFVLDPVMQDCLKRVQGKNKTDKIRWALCLLREYEILFKEQNAYDAQGMLQTLMERTTQRYRNGLRSKVA